jgi:hypothetical protein
VTSLYTDGYGEIEVYLNLGTNYKVFITKTGFNDFVDDYIPDINIRTKIFKISYSSIVVNVTYDFWDLILFNGTMYTNDTILVCYEDINLNTTDAVFYVFELYNDTSTLVATESTNNDLFSFWVTSINTSRAYQVVIYLNHTVLGFKTMTILISPIYSGVDTASIEAKIRNVFGNFDLGFVNFFLIFLPAIVLLILPGMIHPGLGIIGCGLYLGFAGFFFGLPSTFVLLTPFIIAIGIILLIVKGGIFKL